MKLGLDGELAKRKVNGLLLLAQSDTRGFLLSQAAAHSTGFLLAQVGRNKLGVSILQAQRFALLLAEHSQDTSNGLAHLTDLSNFGGSTVGNFLDAKRRQLGLQIREIVKELGVGLLTKLEGLDSFRRLQNY